MSRMVLRVWLPDRPGALGAVASRVGAVKGDVVGIDVVERDGGVAIDELVVDLADDSLLDLMLAEIRQVDGVGVEEVHRDAGAPADPAAGALAAAGRIMGAKDPDELAQVLVDQARALVGSDWASLLASDRPAVLAASGPAPHHSWLGAFRDGLAGDVEGPLDPVLLAVAAAGADLLLGRQSRPMRGRERDRLVGLVELASTRWEELTIGSSRRYHPSGGSPTQGALGGRSL